MSVLPNTDNADRDADGTVAEAGPQIGATGPGATDVQTAVDPDDLGRSGVRGERAEIGRPFVRPARLAGLIGFFALLFVWRGLPVLVIVAAILVMIFLHELGHFVMARRAGMKVTEFMIGFGPRIWSFRRGDVEYGIKAIPAGAYVKIIGMANLEEVAPQDEDRTYRQKGYLARMGVAVAGSTMHFVLALLLTGAALVFVGRFDETNWVVSTVVPGSAADNAGIRSTDRILAIDGVEVRTHAQMAVEAKKRPGETVPVAVVRGGKETTLTASITPRFNFYGTIAEDAIAYGNTAGGVSLSLTEGGSLEAQGLRDGDAVTSVNGTPVTSVDGFRRAVTGREIASTGRMELVVARDGRPLPDPTTVDLGTAIAAEPIVGFLGVGEDLVAEKLGVLQAVPASFSWFGETAWQSMQGLARFFTPSSLGRFAERTFSTTPGQTHAPSKPTSATASMEASHERDGNRMLSIVGAVAFGEKLSEGGWGNLISLLASLNLVIGIFNLLPLPPFDGGHVAIGTYEKIREMIRRDGKRYLVDFNKVIPLATAVVVVMAAVGLMAIYLDLADPIKV